MNPDENQNEPVQPQPVTTQPNQLYTPSQPIAQPVAPASVQEATATTQLVYSKKSHVKLWLAIAIVILVIVGVGAYAYMLGSKSTSNASVPMVSVKPVLTNSWTGNANTYNWNDAANWSLGKPVNGQNLEINVANVKQPADHTTFNFQNDVSNLSINKLLINGSVDSVGFNIKGNPLTITGGIEDTVTVTGKNAAIPSILIDSLITFTGTPIVKATGKNDLTFYNEKSGTVIDLGNSTLQFMASDDAMIDISGAIAGTGTVTIPTNAIGQKSSLDFRTSSPDFKGKVVIGSGDLVSIGNEDLTASTGIGLVNGFGGSSIEIKDGGALNLTVDSSTGSYILPNDITMGGNGVPKATTGTGDRSGAINACISSSQEFCALGTTLNFTGKVTLTGNTQLGASIYGGVGDPGTTRPTGTTVTYTLPNLSKGNYTLTAVPGSMAVIK